MEGPARLTAVMIEATTPAGGFRVLTGKRLRQFSADYFEPFASELPGLGVGAVVGLDNRSQLPATAFRPDAASTFHAELTGLDEETAREALGVLRPFFGDHGAQALVEIGLSTPAPWSLDEVQHADPSLGPGALRLDLCIATYQAGLYCCQHAHLVAGASWVVCMWQPPIRASGELVDGEFPLPGSRVRERFTHTDVLGSSGSERLARIVQDIMRHNEYQAELLSAVVEDWERRFFAAFGEIEAAGRDEAIRDLQMELAGLREFLSLVHLANKTIWRRAQNQPAIPDIVRGELVHRCRELEIALHDQRADLRQAFALLGGAAAELQTRIAHTTQARMHALTGLGTYVTGVVLVPSLVAAFYGANVVGLPGQGKEIGLIYLLVASIVAALITVWLFARARRATG